MSIKKHIPNTITTLNLVFGIVGVVLAFEGRPDCAFYCMLAAALADFLDGTAARLLKAYSPMGKELDSLCDVVRRSPIGHALQHHGYFLLDFTQLALLAGAAAGAWRCAQAGPLQHRPGAAGLL